LTWPTGRPRRRRCASATARGTRSGSSRSSAARSGRWTTGWWCAATAGKLFLAITRHRTIGGTGLTSHAVYSVLPKRQREAGVAKLSPEVVRRTFVGDLLGAGVNLSTVQQLAGHASVATTACYDRRGEATKRRRLRCSIFPTVGSAVGHCGTQKPLRAKRLCYLSLWHRLFLGDDLPT